MKWQYAICWFSTNPTYYIYLAVREFEQRREVYSYEAFVYKLSGQPGKFMSVIHAFLSL
jgi:hypothetical protein